MKTQKKRKARILSFVLSAAMMTAMLPVTVSAGGGISHDISSGSLTLSTGDGCSESNPHVVAGSTSTNAIEASAGEHYITLDGADIDKSGSGCAFNISGTSVIHLELAAGKTNTLKSNSSNAGLHVGSSATAIIGGTGTLNATGGSYAAGIGGKQSETSGTITINDGVINATGGTTGAGIGGGYSKAGGTTTINGGTVNATGGDGGAGIGGGGEQGMKNGTAGAGGTVRITGGTVNATGSGSSAGIGGGGNISRTGGAGGTIEITGGTITAAGKGSGAYSPSNGGPNYGAGIGGGGRAAGGNISITGGTVTATGGLNTDDGSTDTGRGAAVGAGYQGTAGSLVLTDMEAKYKVGDSYTGATRIADNIIYEGETDVQAPDVKIAAVVYTVTFDSSGGSAVPAITDIAKNAKITAPAAPAKSGFTFGGWYKENTLTNAWDFGTDTVTGNVTLYAKWIAMSYDAIVNNGTGSGKYSEGDTVTITANAPAEGKQFKEWTVVSGGAALANAAGAATSFIMPACSVEVTAVYEDKKAEEKISFTSGNCRYKVTSDKKDGTGTVKMEGLAKGKSVSKLSVGKTVTWQGVSYRITAVGDRAFYNNKKIKEVNIGNNVTTIGKDAFKGCSRLTTVVIGNKVSELKSAAFYKCTSLKKVTIGTGLKKMGSHMFCNDKKLTSLTIKSKKLTKIGKHNLYGSPKLKIKVPSSKVKAYTKLFKGQGQKKSVKITK